MKTRTVICALLFLLCSTIANAHNFEVDGIYYNITDAANRNVEVTYKGNSIYEYDEYQGNIRIPSTVVFNGITYNVTGIGSQAFYGCRNLTEVTMPNSVKTIKYEAFAFCENLKRITIPNSVTAIEGLFIFYSKNIESIVVESGNTVYDSRNNCNAIVETATNKLVAGCKNSTIPGSVTTIGHYAFYNCNIKEIVLPNSVTTIENYAFDSCDSIKTITIPSNVKTIKTSAFGSCEMLERIVVENGNTIYDSRNNCNAIIETATNKLIIGCNKTTIPGNVATIDESAFAGLSGITDITIPGSVKHIEYGAFMSCINLERITLSNGIERIENQAFSDCRKLQSITIPNSIKFVNGTAFAFCSSFANILLEDGNTVYDNRENCNALIETATNTLAVGCKNSRIPNSVTCIGEGAFYGRSGMTNITIPNSVTIIENRAFYNCNGFINISIPGSVTKIGDYAFSSCGNLESIMALGTTAPELGHNTFGSLETLYYPSGSDYSSWGNYFANFEETHSNKENTLESININASPGKQATLSLNLKNTAAITGYQCDIYLPEGFTVATGLNGKELIGISGKRTSEQGHTLQFSKQPDGAIRIVSYSASNQEFNGNEGEVLTITLNVPSNTKNGEYIVRVQEIELTDKNGKSYNIPLTVSTIRVNTVTPGDVNNDGRFSITDVQGIINLILSPETSGTNPAADFNSDGEISVLDLQGVVNRILNIPATANRAANRSADMTTEMCSLYIEPFSINAGEEKDIAIMLENPGDAFTSLQFDICLPEGIEIVNRPELGSRTSPNEHNSPQSAIQENGMLRVLCYSDKGHEFSGESGDIIVLTVKANENITGGTYELEVNNIELVRMDLTSCKPESTTSLVTVGESTEVDIVTEGEFMQEAIYDLQGRRIEEITKAGIYIINGKKVLIKD